MSLFANGVRRLSDKMTQGGLTKGEQGLLDTHMHLLRQKVYQLHGPMAFIPHPPHQQQSSHLQQPHLHLQQQQQSLPPPINHFTAPCLDSSAATAIRPASPQRRRTKRMFTDRACHHCETRFTSQWRTGPSGPSTYAPPLFFLLLLERTVLFDVSWLLFLAFASHFCLVQACLSGQSASFLPTFFPFRNSLFISRT